MALYKRGNNWWIDYYYQERRYREKIGTTKTAAETALNQIKVKIAAGDFIPPEERKSIEEERKRQEEARPKPVMFEDFAVKELLPWSEVTHSVRHYGNQQLILQKHLIPHFKGKALEDIAAKDIQGYINKRSRATYRSGKGRRKIKKASVNRDLACIKLLFRKAVEWGKIEQSPALTVKAFKEVPNPPRLLEQEEVVRLLAELPDRLYALAACAVYAGLRKQELFYLRWEDINWRKGELNVVSREEHHTKNYQSRRVPMNHSLAEALRRHPRRLESPYVFCNRQGKPYDNVVKALQGAGQRAGIAGGAKLHQLRHAFCSHALMQGIDPRTVQKWMGHRDLGTTLRYAHVSPDHEKAAIQRLNYQESAADQGQASQAG